MQMNGLTKVRIERKMSVEQMASELCITPKEYMNYEKNSLSMPLPILKLASLVFNVPTQKLIRQQVGV